MSVAIPVIGSVDGFARKIYLANGIREYHPVNDIAAELQQLRNNDEAHRAYSPLVIEQGGVFKGGSIYTGKYALFLEGAEVIPADDLPHELNIIAEQIDGLGKVGIDLVNKTGLVNSVNVNYLPPPSTEVRVIVELVEVGTSGLTQDESNLLSACATQDDVYGAAMI